MWADVNRVWRKALALYEASYKKNRDPDRGWRLRDSAGQVLIDFILSYPPEARRAAAMSLAAVKWHESNFREDIRGSGILCGCCMANMSEVDLWICEETCPARLLIDSVPIVGGCADLNRADNFKRLLDLYTKEWNKLPAKWKEVA